MTTTPDPIAAVEREGWELVPKSAIMWLIGAGPDANGEWFEKPDGAPAFWWRTHFNKLRADAVKDRAALSALVEDQPVAEQWCAYEDGHQTTSWYPAGYGDRVGWNALARRNPEKYQVVTRALYASPARSALAPAPAGEDVVVPRERLLKLLEYSDAEYVPNSIFSEFRGYLTALSRKGSDAQTLGGGMATDTPAPEARTGGPEAFEIAAKLIEENIIQDTSAGKVLRPRQDGNRDGLHYAAAIRSLSAMPSAAGIGEPQAWSFEWKPRSNNNPWTREVSLRDPRTNAVMEIRNVLPLYPAPQTRPTTHRDPLPSDADDMGAEGAASPASRGVHLRHPLISSQSEPILSPADNMGDGAGGVAKGGVE
jgi:hypothetical protein